MFGSLSWVGFSTPALPFLTSPPETSSEAPLESCCRYYGFHLFWLSSYIVAETFSVLDSFAPNSPPPPPLRPNFPLADLMHSRLMDGFAPLRHSPSLIDYYIDQFFLIFNCFPFPFRLSHAFPLDRHIPFFFFVGLATYAIVSAPPYLTLAIFFLVVFSNGRLEVFPLLPLLPATVLFSILSDVTFPNYAHLRLTISIFQESWPPPMLPFYLHLPSRLHLIFKGKESALPLLATLASP